MSVFICFQGFRLVFHFSRSVFMGFQGFRLVFQGSMLPAVGWLWPSDDDDDDDDDDDLLDSSPSPT